MGTCVAACNARAVVMGVARLGQVATETIAGWSRRALDAQLDRDALLVLARPASDAVVVGGFQRASENATGVFARGSGGGAATVGPGTLWIVLALAHPAALVPCTPSHILNRNVRPLLRALTKVGATAHYFGRDWVSVEHRPAALVAFAHDATTRRTIFEAIVAVSRPFATGARASFRDKAPGTLEEIARRPFDLDAIESAIVHAYANAHAVADVDLDLDLDLDLAEDLDRTPWLSSIDEAIGEVCAGPDARGVFRVGGDLMASRDAVHALEGAAVSVPTEDTPRLAALVNDIFTAPGVAIEGVRDLASIARTIQIARLRQS